MLKRLSSACILVNDLKQSLHFYCDILGLKVNYTNDGFAGFTVDGIGLSVFQKSDAVAMYPSQYMNKGGGILLGFQVKDVATTVNELTKKGITVFEGPKKTAWGQTVAYFSDPDGNIWEISNEDFKE